MKKLRLLLFEKCNRRCKGCCNNEWDLEALPICYNYSGYDEIMLTGGEPMLRPDLVRQVVREIREQSNAKIYLYTAKVDDLKASLDIIKRIDGMTVTLHEQADLASWIRFSLVLKSQVRFSTAKSLRLNVFRGVNTRDVPIKGWIVQDNMEWVADCPLPDDEVFMRLKI